MNAGLLTAAGLSWQRGGDVRVSVSYAGAAYSVLIPSESVRFVIERHAAQEHLALPAGVGAVDLVGWFGSKLLKKAKRAAKGVYKKAKKVAKKTVKTLRATAKKAVPIGKKLWDYTRKAVTSDELGYLVLASSVVCPAIGGPAFMALQAAKRADKMLKAGGVAAKTVQSNVRRIASGPQTSNGRLLLSALKSTR